MYLNSNILRDRAVFDCEGLSTFRVSSSATGVWTNAVLTLKGRASRSAPWSALIPAKTLTTADNGVATEPIVCEGLVEVCAEVTTVETAGAMTFAPIQIDFSGG